jgi:D-threo-aldose 1-dehydrogenase
VAAIGAGVNEWEVCQTLAERGDFDLFLLAGRYTLLEQEPLESFLPLCEARASASSLADVQFGHPRHRSGAGRALQLRARAGAHSGAGSPNRGRLQGAQCPDARCGLPVSDAAPDPSLGHPGGQSVPNVHANLRAAGASVPPALWADLKAEGLMRADAPTG